MSYQLAPIILDRKELERLARWHGELGQGAIAALCDQAIAQLEAETPATHDLIADLVAALAWCSTHPAIRSDRSWPHIAQPALDAGKDFLKGQTHASR